ncbi:M23 family metallopeptidase [Helicobacter sp. MIT 99-5507]|uniref:M23 family metallopeptidase n=1 Tax=Helicobacter sp. MIT 99-5507 TaxID=152489 RepID=UPI000E1F3508|nr:M23 family metallopeptidase [Helicobacter sp. MIT 99-5507]RDU58538.1 peptidase [Helicobacter sp. MIT 99-5507]
MNSENRLILMISSPYGARYYNVNLIFKHIIIYFFTFIGSIVFFILIALHTLASEINNIENKYKYIEDSYQTLLDKNLSLLGQISAKKEEFLLIADKIEDLEGIIGVVNDNPNYGLQNRVEAASITGLQKIFIMKFVPNGLPLDSYKRISSGYGYRIHPLNGSREFHAGIDFSSNLDTPVYATADGVVDFAKDGWNGGYGTLVKIDHSFGFKTYYAHLHSFAVKRGQFVKKGQLIAYVGNTGVSTGAHLHYEVRFLGSHINPKHFTEWDMSNFDKIFNKEKNVAWQSLLMTINNLMLQIPTEQRLSQQKQNLKES